MKIKPYIRKAQYYETDQMGIIHHSNYIRWFEEARVDFMEQMDYGYNQAVESGIDFAVLGITCEYKSMVRFGDTVRIELEISEFSAAKMAISYRIYDNTDGTLRTTGESRHCYYHNQKKRPVSLKKSLPDLYEQFAALAQKPE